MLYAAVTPQKLEKELQKSGYNVLAKQIMMKPLKEIGSFEVKIKFRHGLEAGIVVIVAAN